MKINPDASAFGHGDHHHGGAPGLTKREYFAAHALQGLLASGAHNKWTCEDAAHDAVLLADALIKALNGETK